MSVWLTPELKPFIGGTYFPPRDQRGRPGLKTVLIRILEQVKSVVSTMLTNIAALVFVDFTINEM